MKLASYEWQGSFHVGFCLGAKLYSLTRLAAESNSGQEEFDDMSAFLSRGATVLEWAQSIEQAVASGKNEYAQAACPLSEARFLPPVPKPEKIICIGRNYADHAQETGADLPKEPLFFTKFNSALIGANDPIILPRVSQKVDYEAELAVIIGREGKYISEQDALEHVAGYMVFNDVSARDWQYRTGQFTAGKTFDTFAACGPFLVTKDEAPDPHTLSIKLTLNGQVMQDANTSLLIFNIPYLIAYLSQLFPLQPGDIISTGTPAGVGAARKPPVFLKPGDQIKIEIERIGALESVVRDE